MKKEEGRTQKFKIKTYGKSGYLKREYYFDTIEEALEKYVECRNNISDFWNRMAYCPTIYINTDLGFVRIHDFAFSKLTPDTVEKYLNERIIDTDELLATISMKMSSVPV